MQIANWANLQTEVARIDLRLKLCLNCDSTLHSIVKIKLHDVNLNLSFMFIVTLKESKYFSQKDLLVT